MKKKNTSERTVCAVTGSRAEYSQLAGLMKAVQSEPGLKLLPVATGMHLAPEYGLTVSEVERDFPDVIRIKSMNPMNTPEGVSLSIAEGISGFAAMLAEKKPDLMLVLGDRFEIFAAVTAAFNEGIPVAHIHGGETTQGAADEAFRHCITKMSHIHLTAAEPYRKRVIQLGEDPSTVFDVGGMGASAIDGFEPMSRSELEKSINFSLGDSFFLVTFHPVTLEPGSARRHFRALLDALETRPAAKVLFTASNADAGGAEINSMIAEYTSANADRCVFVDSLGKERYFSAVSHADALIGNSSSGIAEAPGFKTPSVNIGSRQAGRIRAASVIDCEPETADIVRAIEKVYSADFRKVLQTTVNPYGSKDNTKAIVDILKNTPLDGILIKKFYDLPQL